MKKIKLTVDGIVRYNGRRDSYGIENAGNTAFFKEMENRYGKRRKRVNISGYREIKQNEWKA